MSKEAAEFYMERMGESIESLGEILRKAEKDMRMTPLEFIQKWGQKLHPDEWAAMFGDLLNVWSDGQFEAQKYASKVQTPTQSRLDCCPKCNERTEGRPHFCPCPT